MIVLGPHREQRDRAGRGAEGRGVREETIPELHARGCELAEGRIVTESERKPEGTARGRDPCRRRELRERSEMRRETRRVARRATPKSP